MMQPTTGVSLAIDQRASSAGVNSFGTSVSSASGTSPRPMSQRVVRNAHRSETARPTAASAAALVSPLLMYNADTSGSRG
jgi:pyruvate/oxaloacetate carboxyltransferase